jgi:UDP-3-O-[3-hydroxymyristoyl] N-acetylglucosamine deacetylase
LRFETTVQRAAEASGIGLHSGVPVSIRILPAPVSTGIVFLRTDLDNFAIPASWRNVARVSYATSLMKKGVLISTTEHLLAALYSCGVDNVYVEIDALEVPILDGSAKPFIEMLERAGIRRLRRRRRYLQVVKPLEFEDSDPNKPGQIRRIGIYPCDQFRVHCYINYPHPLIGSEEFELDVNRETFSRELGPARTFGFLHEEAQLRAVGLIRGVSYDNAVVLDRERILNGPTRFPDEFVRHKALDLIGDLALLGRPLKALVVAHKAGHALHTQLVTRLLADHSLWVETSGEAHAPLPEFAASRRVAAND